MSDGAPFDRWRALRPDQRGAVYAGLAQLVANAADEHSRRVTVIGDCDDLRATYRDTGVALGVAVDALRVAGAATAFAGVPPEYFDRLTAVLRAVVAAPLPVRRTIAGLCRGQNPVAIGAQGVWAALADLIEPGAE